LRYRGEGRNSRRTETHWRLISMIFIEVKHLVVCSSFHHFKCVYIYTYIPSGYLTHSYGKWSMFSGFMMIYLSKMVIFHS
jgi:hypothetical protein